MNNIHCSGEDLSAYMDGEMAAERKDYVERHCAVCERCRDELRQLERMRRMVVASDPAAGLDERDLTQAVMRRIRMESAVRRSIWPSVPNGWRWAAAAAACVAVVAVSAYFVLPAMVSDREPLVAETEEVDYNENLLFDQPEDWLVAAAADEQDIDLIIDSLMPAEIVDTESPTDTIWPDSSVAELLDAMSVTEVQDLRKELYQYATQG